MYAPSHPSIPLSMAYWLYMSFLCLVVVLLYRSDPKSHISECASYNAIIFFSSSAEMLILVLFALSGIWDYSWDCFGSGNSTSSLPDSSEASETGLIKNKIEKFDFI